MRFTTNLLFGFSSLALAAAHTAIVEPQPDPGFCGGSGFCRRSGPNEPVVAPRSPQIGGPIDGFVDTPPNNGGGNDNSFCSGGGFCRRSAPNEPVVAPRSPQLSGPVLGPGEGRVIREPENSFCSGGGFCRRSPQTGNDEVSFPGDDEVITEPDNGGGFCNGSFCRRRRQLQSGPVRPFIPVVINGRSEPVAPRSPQLSGPVLGPGEGRASREPENSFCGSSFCRTRRQLESGPVRPFIPVIINGRSPQNIPPQERNGGGSDIPPASRNGGGSGNEGDATANTRGSSQPPRNGVSPTTKRSPQFDFGAGGGSNSSPSRNGGNGDNNPPQNGRNGDNPNNGGNPPSNNITPTKRSPQGFEAGRSSTPGVNPSNGGAGRQGGGGQEQDRTLNPTKRSPQDPNLFQPVIIPRRVARRQAAGPPANRDNNCSGQIGACRIEPAPEPGFSVDFKRSVAPSVQKRQGKNRSGKGKGGNTPAPQPETPPASDIGGPAPDFKRSVAVEFEKRAPQSAGPPPRPIVPDTPGAGRVEDPAPNPGFTVDFKRSVVPDVEKRQNDNFRVPSEPKNPGFTVDFKRSVKRQSFVERRQSSQDGGSIPFPPIVLPTPSNRGGAEE